MPAEGDGAKRKVERGSLRQGAAFFVCDDFLCWFLFLNTQNMQFYGG
jgi:hypothetical protein